MDKSSEDKHKKYYLSYKKGDFYWGIGIENETYLEIPTHEMVKGSFFNKHKPERYSVNYYNTYNQKFFLRIIEDCFEKDHDYELPLLMNSHELIKNDLSGQPMNNYDKGATPNKKFSGQTIFDYMKEQNIYFKDEYNKSFCFDGDTIEFMTQKFYKTTIQDTINELIYHKKQFLNNINELNLPIANGNLFKYPKKNHGFARFTTNKNNLAIFNNSTYHFNFTLPTELDESGNLKNKIDFIKRHQKAIQIIQAFEPLFIAKYGTPDILCSLRKSSKRFPNGSQRVAASRYISAGTYESTKMKTGKLLQEERNILEKKWPHYFWYNRLYNQINYVKNDNIGFDINFNKFKNHGIELRFFDWFPEEHLEEALTFCVYLLDLSESTKKTEPVQQNQAWNSLMYHAILEGKDYVLTKEELSVLKKDYKLKVIIKNRNIISVYDTILDHFKKHFKYEGPCSKYMLEKPTICNECCSSTFKKIINRLFCTCICSV